MFVGIAGGAKPFIHMWCSTTPSFSGTIPIRNFTTDTPTDEQVKANKGDECNIPKTDLEAVCAHEMGHAFGLDDAYYDFETKTDRCAENDETTVCFNKGDYDNLMKDQIRMKRAKANDIEMMLYAYSITKGFPDSIFQQYNKFDGNEISKVIIDTHDELIEKH